MSMERLIVKNFGPIEQVNIEIPRLLVFIGEQASGKSTLGKLIYIFKRASSRMHGLPDVLRMSMPSDITEIQKLISDEITDKFDPCFYDDDSKIIYYYAKQYYIEVSFHAKDVIITPSEDLKEILTQLRKKYTEFLASKKERETPERPSTKEMVALLGLIDLAHKTSREIDSSSIFEYVQASRVDSKLPSLGMYTSMLDPSVTFQAVNSFAEILKTYNDVETVKKQFVKEAMQVHVPPKNIFEEKGRYRELRRETLRRMQLKAQIYAQLINQAHDLIGGTVEEHEVGYGVAISSKRSLFVPYYSLSSGQRSLLPFVACVSLIGSTTYGTYRNVPFGCAVLEEPEAHVYPSKQFLMIKLVAAALAINDTAKFVITTHSPYILASIHALSAYGLAGGNVEALSEYDDLVPIQSDRENLGIYLLKNGHAESLRDEESGLFDTSEIDSISEEINEVFDESVIAREMKKGGE